MAATTSTDSLGNYRLALPTASYRILAYDLAGVWATNFYSSATSFETSAQIDLKANLTGVDFPMVRGVTVSGLVRSSVGDALSGMTVAAYNADGTRRGFQNTNSTGTFSILLPHGTYRFAAYDENINYTTAFYLGQTSYDAATPVVVASAPVTNVNFVLIPSARAFGTTYDAKTTLSVPGMTANAYTTTGVLVATTTSGSNGHFSMALPPGDFKFTAFDPAGHYAVSFFDGAATFASAASFHLVTGQTLTGIDFLLGPVVPPGSPTTLFVPAAVNLAGANSTYFQTDLWITNPLDAALPVNVTFLPAGQDNSAQTGTSVPVPAHAQIALANVLQERREPGRSVSPRARRSSRRAGRTTTRRRPGRTASASPDGRSGPR